jgi:hypothetical protein
MAGRSRVERVAGLVVHSDPVALVGIVVSVALSVALDLTGAASGVESLLAGLAGTTLSLVLDASARAERRFELRGLLRGPDWLAGAVTGVAGAAQDVLRRYPDGDVEAEVQRRLRQLSEDLDELRRGRVERPGGDAEHLFTGTRSCRHRMEAVTNVIGSPGWWDGDVGRRYWQENLDALARGVTVSRVFLCDEPTPELLALVDRQRSAGVAVSVLRRRTIPANLHLNVAVWDGCRGWEARMSAAGQIVGNILVVNQHDVDRLAAVVRDCRQAAG